MGKRTEKLNIALLAAAVLLCLTLFTTHLVGGLYARYTTSAESSDGARVARYAFDVKGGTTEQEFTINLAGIKKPGDPASVTFTVTNANENGVCEVAQQYTVYVTELGSLPLTYSIGNTNAKAMVAGSEKVLLTGNLAAGVEDSETITLNISWPDDETNPNYAGGVASLHIRIVAEQID